MSNLWWQSWSIEDLSPLNSAAVVSMQLDPPDWEEAWQQSHGQHQFWQLWWLNWHARPDLRENLLEVARLPNVLARSVVIHPDTIHGWAEPPRWANAELRERERDVRSGVLRHYPLPVEQCQRVHTETWNPMSLGFQSAQSETHVTLLLAQIRKLGDVAFEQWLVEYVRWTRTLTGPCGVYVQERILRMTWPRWLASTLVVYLKAFPEELMPCLLNSPDTDIRQMGVDLSRKQKERR